MTLWLALSLLTAQAGDATPPPAASVPTPGEAGAKGRQEVDAATTLIQSGRSDEAVPVLDRAIAELDRTYAGEKRQIFCARSPTEMLMYAAMGAKAKRDTVVDGPEWATLIFLKGFALIDIGRSDEAKPLFDRAIALSPLNSQFLAEEAEWYKSRKDWAAAYGLFERASAAAEFSPPDADHSEKRRALRGMGYALSEQRRFDEAEKLYRECLKLFPQDKIAISELEYIREQRAKGGAKDI